MLRKTGHERVRSHNFHVAATKEASFLPAYGDKLLTYSLPLIPYDAGELAAINIRLLTEGEAEITGGEPTTAFYRHRQPTRPDRPPNTHNSEGRRIPCPNRPERQ